MKFLYSKFEVRLLDKLNKNEVEEVQRLRYDHLLRDFNPELKEGGIDNDGYDEYADGIIVVDTENNNKIVGTYRVATKTTVGSHKFTDEDEFNIDSIKNGEENILELGRAVVHKDYRSGVVIQLLWTGLYEYAVENKCRYIFGTTSLHGTDPSKFKNLLCYFKKDLSFELPVFATNNSFEFDYLEDYDQEEVAKEMPNLVKAYIKMGVKISKNGYIDYNFNSCDIMTVADMNNINTKFFERLKKFLR